MINRYLSAAVAACVLMLVGAVSSFADCGDVVGVDCEEHLGVGKKGSHFRLTIPTNPVWNGDVVLINHGFDLDQASIRPHHTCKVIGGACTTNADCGSATCNDISYLGLDAFFLPRGMAVAASTYSLTGWSVFNSRKDLQDILTFMKKTPGIGSPTRTFITGFSMGGAVTVDASLRMNPTRIQGILPLCPAGAGGVPTWDAAHDARMAYDYVCGDVSGAGFFSASDEGDSANEVAMALKVNNCFGNVLPEDDPVEAANKAARLAQFKTLIGHTGTDFEVVVLMGFATQGMYDLVHDKDKLSDKRYGNNIGLVYNDAGLDAGIERVEEGKGRKKLNKNYFVDYTRGKGGKLEYPIVHLANNADFLTVPAFQSVFMQGTDDGSKARTTAWIDGGGHCNFTPEEIEATATEFMDWVDGDPQPTAADIEATCLALPTGNAGTTCRFDLPFVPPLLSDRAPRRADWPAAAQ